MKATPTPTTNNASPFASAFSSASVPSMDAVAAQVDAIGGGGNDPASSIVGQLLRDGGAGPPPDTLRQQQLGELVTAEGSGSGLLDPPAQQPPPPRTGKRSRNADGDQDDWEDDDDDEEDDDDDDDDDDDEHAHLMGESGNIKRPRTEDTVAWTKEVDDCLMDWYMTKQNLKRGIPTANEGGKNFKGTFQQFPD